MDSLPHAHWPGGISHWPRGNTGMHPWPAPKACYNGERPDPRTHICRTVSMTIIGLYPRWARGGIGRAQAGSNPLTPNPPVTRAARTLKVANPP